MRAEARKASNGSFDFSCHVHGRDPHFLPLIAFPQMTTEIMWCPGLKAVGKFACREFANNEDYSQACTCCHTPSSYGLITNTHLFRFLTEALELHSSGEGMAGLFPRAPGQAIPVSAYFLMMLLKMSLEQVYITPPPPYLRTHR